jgi:hypothetical protein
MQPVIDYIQSENLKVIYVWCVPTSGCPSSKVSRVQCGNAPLFVLPSAIPACWLFWPP